MTEPLSTQDYEARIRERAQQLWEEAGRPEGQSDHFWYAAQHAFEAEHPEFAHLHGGAQPAPSQPEDPTRIVSDIAGA